jgi:hypothetical protein
VLCCGEHAAAVQHEGAHACTIGGDSATAPLTNSVGLQEWLVSNVTIGRINKLLARHPLYYGAADSHGEMVGLLCRPC